MNEDFVLATCASALNSGTVRLLFPGETSASSKYYKVLNTDGISNGTRVVCAKISGSYVVLGAFGAGGGGGGGSGTVTSVGITNGGGLSVSGSPVTTSGDITVGHSNSVAAQNTQAVYPIKIDANGHIKAYGTAVAIPTYSIGSITTTTAWSGAGPYTQAVTVSGAAVSASSKVDLQPDAATIAQLIGDGVQALFVTNNSGTLTMTAVGAAPSSAMTVQCSVVETV